MKNEFSTVPEEVCLRLLGQAHSTGGSVPPALTARLRELSKEDGDYVGPFGCDDAKSTQS